MRPIWTPWSISSRKLAQLFCLLLLFYGLASASYLTVAHRKAMGDQFKTILIKAKLNFAILASILVIAVLGKFTNPELTNSIFVTADQLVSDLYIVFIAITLGAFVPNFKLVAFGSIAAFVVAAALVQMGVYTYLTTEYLFAVLIVVLGFASIANLYKHYRENGL